MGNPEAIPLLANYVLVLVRVDMEQHSNTTLACATCRDEWLQIAR